MKATQGGVGRSWALDCVVMENLNYREKQDMQRWEQAFQASGMGSAKSVGWGRTWSVPETHRHDGRARQKMQEPGLRATQAMGRSVNLFPSVMRSHLRV